MDKFRKYVQEEKMYVCTIDCLPPEAKFMCSPSTTVAKKLPDITISADRRAIWGGRRVDLECPTIDYWALGDPTLEDLARTYCYLKASAAGIRIV